MANRNRTAGHNLERDIVKELKELGFDVVTSRSESRSMDNKKVDIFSPLGVDNSLPYYIQTKCTVNIPNYCQLLTEMPKDRIPVVIHRKTEKKGVNFMAQGDFVTITKETFYNLIKP